MTTKLTPTVLANLDAMNSHYEALFRDLLTATLSGEERSFRNYRGPEMSALATLKMFDDDAWNIREAWFMRALHNGLRALDAKNKEALRELFRQTRDTVLHSVASWLAVHGPIEKTSWETFVDGVNIADSVYQRQLGVLGRPLLLVTLVLNDVTIVERWCEQCEMFPHRFFHAPPVTAGKLFAQADREVAADIEDVVTDAQRMAFARIRDFVVEGSGRAGRRGRFVLDINTRLSWQFDSSDVVRRAELEAYVEEVRRPTYELLGRIGNARYQALSERGLMNPARWNDRRSRFNVSPTLYTITRQALDAYCFNQYVVPWVRSSGGVVPHPVLAEQRGFRAHVVRPGVLRVSDYSDTAREFTTSSSPYDTTQYLPICVYLVDRFVRAADELLCTES